MMKIKIILVLLVLFVAAPQVYGQKGWPVSARAGLIAVPHTLAAQRLGSGVQLGLSVQPYSTKNTDLSLSLDYRKVDNLVMEKLEHLIVVLPDGFHSGNEFLRVTGFAAMRLGLRLDREIGTYRKGTLKVSLASYAELLTFVRGSQLSDVTTRVVHTQLQDTDEDLFISTPGGSGSSSISRNTSDDGRIVFAGGAGLIYELAAGPQIELGFQIDLNDRFSTFTGSSDARLTQLSLGFNYPFSTKKNK